MKTTLKLFCLLLLVIPSHAFAEDEWEFIIAPYVLLPSISGDTSAGIIEDAEVDVDPGDILDHLDMGGMLYLEAQHNSGFGAMLHYAFMDLSDSTTGPLEFRNLRAEIFQGILEGYLSYRVDTDHGPLDFYSGIRWWDMDVDLKVRGVEERKEFNADGSWVDPVIGARWVPQVGEDLHLLIKADIGGFDVSSDMSWNVQGGIIWDIREYMALTVQYRALSVDYETGEVGTADRFAYDTITHGPMIGVAFRL